MAFLNYHHLRYFRAIALSSSLTKAAKQLGLSQSALSVQLRHLEESLGQALFERQHKALVLTEAGRIALQYADTIFQSGEELMDVLKNQASRSRSILRVGAVANLSRNFQLRFLQPVIGKDDVELIIHSGTLRELLSQLQAHTLDVVLTNTAIRRDTEVGWHCHLLDEQPVSLVGQKRRGKRSFQFPHDLRTVPIVLPSLESSIRSAFDLRMDQLGIRPMIAAEVDDMAMLRLMARESLGVTLVPSVVVKDELERGELVEKYRFSDIKETFYAITPSRRFPNPILRILMASRGRSGK
ncbi:LysR family transcriptional regulator, transcriptional activator of nhaA [Prosthecobacter debontii]|uniref:LysR family transcriptional regulator, transcriptional activator of nhaA n=1 Tax=Prosthecobacter debontii TaxID=48467 RepID=A0A1T4XHH6_9BACT|nr:LysR family transcriptional regulator [Prosthecobacter debontii]SKA88571.1 LysR family transcriptional regulator, transcriptional activator of nhaA [Prosthecobacter debontii]